MTLRMGERITHQTGTAAPADLHRMILASCALVGLSYWLGAAWLRDPVLGVPGGVWAVAVVFALLRWGTMPLGRGRSFELSRLVRPFRKIPEIGASGLNAVRHTTAEHLTRAARAIDTSSTVWTSEDGFVPTGRATTSGPRRVVVGVSLTGAQGASIAALAGTRDSVRVRQFASGENFTEKLAQFNLHALLHGGAGAGATLRTLSKGASATENAIESAGETDHPLGYATIFHGSAGPSNLALHDFDGSNQAHAALVFDLAAFLGAVSSFGPADPCTAQQADALTGSLRRARATGAPVSLLHPAAEALSNWCCAPGRIEHAPIRVRAGETAVSLLREDPAVALRLAGLRFSEAADSDAHAELDQARALMASRNWRPQPEAILPFIESELAFDTPDDDYLVGRLASGIALLAECENSGASCEDLIDDIRCAPALLQREQDAAMLIALVRSLMLGERRVHAEVDAGVGEGAMGVMPSEVGGEQAGIAQAA